MGLPTPPKAPDVAMPPPAAHPATLASTSAAAAMKGQRQSAKESVYTDAGTIATSPQGIPTGSARSTLLGQ